MSFGILRSNEKSGSLRHWPILKNQFSERYNWGPQESPNFSRAFECLSTMRPFLEKLLVSCQLYQKQVIMVLQVAHWILEVISSTLSNNSINFSWVPVDLLPQAKMAISQFLFTFNWSKMKRCIMSNYFQWKIFKLIHKFGALEARFNQSVAKEKERGERMNTEERLI